MLYNGKYEINPSDIIDGSIKWETTGSGAYIVCEHKGKKYFVKRFTMGPRRPSKSLPVDMFKKYKESADWLENKQKEISALFKAGGITTDKDRIVIEEENFWDEDNMFATVTRLIPDENKDFDYTKLDFATFVKLCKDMASLLIKLHGAGITHGDLKEKNFLIQKKGGELIPYLIDFDSSYPSDYSARKKADGMPLLACPVVYSAGYQSPEIAIYNYQYEEEDTVGDASTITNKTDIFTLAIVFHKLWTGHFPAVVGDSCYVGEAVYCDFEISIDGKFNVELGDKNHCAFSTLLRWMMTKEPDKRPTASQVVDALADAIDVESVFEGKDSSNFDIQPHAVHKNNLEIFDEGVLRKANVKSFRKAVEGGVCKYLVKLKDGSEKLLTADEVISSGYGAAKKGVECALWAEDEEFIELASEQELLKQGVISIEPKQSGYKKYYYVTYLSGGGFSTSRSGLINSSLAKKKVKIVSDLDVDTPWAEHGSAYNTDALSARNIVKVEKVEDGGEKCYLLTKNDGGEEKQTIVKANYMKLFKYID